ncbi:MAG: hypothetical protein ABSG90_07565 [Dehalococcoidia bacterium]|jgi:hypothetical protein
MIPNKFSGLSILLILALLISTFAFMVPATIMPVPVSAISENVTSVVINSVQVNSGTPGPNVTVHANGLVTVYYTVTGSTTGPGEPVTVQISTSPNSSYNYGTANYNTTGYQNNLTVQIDSHALQGTYNVSVLVGTVQATPLNNSVTVTTSTLQISLTQPTTLAGWSTVSTSVQNPLSFSVSSPTTTATVQVLLTITNGTNVIGPTNINSFLTPIPITGPIQSFSGFLVPAASAGGNPLVMGQQGTFTLQITATDGTGYTAPTVTFGPFSLVSGLPVAGVSSSQGPGSTSGQIFYTGSAGMPIIGTVYIPSALGYFQVGLFTNGANPSSTPTLLTGGFQQAVNGTYGQWSGQTFNITYPWTIPSTVSSQNCYIGIQGKDNMGNVGNWAFSGSGVTAFRIYDNIKPTGSITWPTSGSVHYSGATDNVSWIMTDNVPGNLPAPTIWLNVNNVFYSYIPATGPNTTQQGMDSTPWTVPLISTSTSGSTYCSISENISDNESPPNVTTITGPSFTIVQGQPPTVTSIYSPACGVTWPIASTQTITWTQNDLSSASARLSDNISLSIGGAAPVLVWSFPNMPLGQNSQTISVPDPSLLGFAPSSGSGSTATYSGTLQIQATNTASGQQSAVYTMPCSFTITNSGVFPVQTSPVVTLYPGWNLVSLPLVPTNSSIQNVLGNALPSITAIWTCTGGGSTGGTWSSWSPGYSAYSGLNTMVDGKAYWINTNLTSGNVQFTYQGRVGNPPPSAPPSYTYPAGWNMVGFTLASPSVGEPVQSYLGVPNTTSANYNVPVIGYNANSVSPAFTSLGLSDNMTPGLGYWVFYNAQGTANASMH